MCSSQQCLSEFNGPTMFESHLEFSLSYPVAIRLCPHFPFYIISTKHWLFNFNLLPVHSYINKLHFTCKYEITSLRVTKGKLKLCISSDWELLLNITLWVVRNIRPFFLLLNALASWPDHSMWTLSENNNILK